MDWWASKGRAPILDGHVVRVIRAMQGHPESPHGREKFCNHVIKEQKFTPTTHELCLYSGIWHGEKCYFKCQVDDFEFAAPLVDLAHKFYDGLDDHLTMPIKRQGMVTLFNRAYISTETYIEKMGAKYLTMWHKEILLLVERPLPVPTNTHS
eukprot:CCRYP_016354-RA/>CCRYP_016354-RA protein AED:0.35 eAED:0.35 QI:0/0/0/1/0/0/2/0/151